MRKITFRAHDYIEFEEKGRKYTVDLIYDKHGDEKLWRRDVKYVTRTPLPRLMKTHHVEELVEYGVDTRPEYIKKFFGRL